MNALSKTKQQQQKNIVGAIMLMNQCLWQHNNLPGQLRLD